MEPKSLWRFRLPAAQSQQKGSTGEFLKEFAQSEDEETRIVVTHYLYLADCLLATDTAERKEEDPSAA